MLPAYAHKSMDVWIIFWLLLFVIIFEIILFIIGVIFEIETGSYYVAMASLELIM